MSALRPPIENEPAVSGFSAADPHWRLDAGPRLQPARRRRSRFTRATLLLALPTAIAVSWHAGVDPIDLLRAGYTASLRTLEGLSRPEPKKIATGDPSEPAPKDTTPPALDPPAPPAKEVEAYRVPQRPEDVTAPKAPPPASPAEPAAGPSKRAAMPEPPSEDDADEEPATTIAPPPAALTPAQRRAEAAGLHTGLSRVLLERLTAADYRNASEAIRRALAAPRNDGVHVWPPRPDVASAQFTVRFVAGAPSGCRRYVVTILKDRWETTAQPLQRCTHPQSASHAR